MQHYMNPAARSAETEASEVTAVTSKRPRLIFYFFVPLLCLNNFFMTLPSAVMNFSHSIYASHITLFTMIAFCAVLFRYEQSYYRNIAAQYYRQQKFLRWNILDLMSLLILMAVIANVILEQPFFNPAAVSMLALFVSHFLAQLIFMCLEMRSTIPAADDPSGFKSYHILIMPLLVLVVPLFTVRTSWHTGIVYWDKCIFWLPSLMMIIMLLYGEVLRFQGVGGLAAAVLIGCPLFAGLKQAVAEQATFSMSTYLLIIFNMVTYFFMLWQAVDKFLYQRALRRAQTIR